MTDFIVGAVGHRPNRLPAAEIPRIRSELEQALKRLQGARAPARCMLVSGLAEGTDRMASELALRMGWWIEAILPFSLARYLKDFETEASKAEFRALLTKTTRYVESPAADAYPDQNEGYAEQGDFLVKRADALVTVWDGQGAHGRGGTAEVLAQARKAGKRVLWINTAPGSTMEEIA